MCQAVLLELAQCIAERSGPQWLVDARLAPPLAVMERLLGDIDQAEVGAEGPQHVGRGFGVHPGDHGIELGPGLGVVRGAQSNVTLAQGFHGLEHMIAGMVAQHFAE